MLENPIPHAKSKTHHATLPPNPNPPRIHHHNPIPRHGYLVIHVKTAKDPIFLPPPRKNKRFFPMDFNSNFAPMFPEREASALARSVSFPVRAPLSLEESTSDASWEAESFSSSGEEFDSEEERAVGGGLGGKGPGLGGFSSNVGMPRARLSRDDDFWEGFDDELVEEEDEEEEEEEEVDEGSGDGGDAKDGILEHVGEEEEGEEEIEDVLGGEGDEKDGIFEHVAEVGGDGADGFLGTGEMEGDLHREDGGGDIRDEDFKEIDGLVEDGGCGREGDEKDGFLEHVEEVGVHGANEVLGYVEMGGDWCQEGGGGREDDGVKRCEDYEEVDVEDSSDDGSVIVREDVGVSEIMNEVDELIESSEEDVQEGDILGREDVRDLDTLGGEDVREGDTLETCVESVIRHGDLEILAGVEYEEVDSKESVPSLDEQVAIPVQEETDEPETTKEVISFVESALKVDGMIQSSGVADEFALAAGGEEHEEDHRSKPAELASCGDVEIEFTGVVASYSNEPISAAWFGDGQETDGEDMDILAARDEEFPEDGCAGPVESVALSPVDVEPTDTTNVNCVMQPVAGERELRLFEVANFDETSSVESGVTSVGNNYIIDEIGSKSSGTGRERRIDDGVAALYSIKDVKPGSMLDSEDLHDVVKDLVDVSSTNRFNGSGSSEDIFHQLQGKLAYPYEEVELHAEEQGDRDELLDLAAFAAIFNSATGASYVSKVDLVEAEDDMNDEEQKLHEKLEQIRVNFLRLLHRLSLSPDDAIASQVLYRLRLAETRKHVHQKNHTFSIDSARRKASLLEEDGKNDLEFSCNILVLGKSGVGKSATINSIFGESVSATDAFVPCTKCLKEINGVVNGVRIRMIDTPGLEPSLMNQTWNKKVLSSLKKHVKRYPPDVVLYVDRLDTLSQDLNDLPLLKSISSALGSSIWSNSIVVLTHASYAPDDGPNGVYSSYDMYVAKRSHVVRYCLRLASGDMNRTYPVALAENHPSCRREADGDTVLPNGESWRSRLLLLCFSSKVLSEVNSLLKLDDPSLGKSFGIRLRFPPLSYFLSSLLQSKSHRTLPTDQDVGNGFEPTEDYSKDEYDQLPPFNPLKKSQIAELSYEQRKAYFNEYHHRVSLLEKKHLKEGLKKTKETKKSVKRGHDNPNHNAAADYSDREGTPATVTVPLNDIVLPPTFDCDNPCYHYRFLEPTSTLLVGPILDNHGWDHDCGYDGVTLEEDLVIAGRIPASFAVQVTKDKKKCSIHLESAVSANHGRYASSLVGFDIQTMGKQFAYMLRGETEFKSSKWNHVAGSMSLAFVEENTVTGLKAEDRVCFGRMSMVTSVGSVHAQKEAAYGASVEAWLREDHHLNEDVFAMGLSVKKLGNDLTLGANLETRCSLGWNSKTVLCVGLNNKCHGRISIQTSTSEQLQIALLGILSIAISVFKNLWPGEAHLTH